MRATPIDGPLGIVVEGLDLARIDDAAFDALHRAWLDRLVLVVRGQSLSDAELVGFSHRFGELDQPPVNEADTRTPSAHPGVLVISNVVEDGRPIGDLGNLEAAWHSDMNYAEAPPSASILYALEVPERGGDTGFCDMYAALDALAPALAERIARAHIKHDATTTSAGRLRAGAAAVDDFREAPGASHPAVRVHPETGRPALYLGRRRNAWIEGLPLDESDTLLDALWAHATDARFAWHHRWQVGDLLVWDNRCVMHRRDGFDNDSRRVMHRTQIKGSRPVGVGDPATAG